MLRNIALRFAGVVAVLVIAGWAAPSAQAQVTVGGHVGFVIPWVTHSGGQTTNIGDNFQIGFPLGVTFHGPGRMNLDLEMVPSFSDSPRSVTLTVDPGLVWGLDGYLRPYLEANPVVRWLAGIPPRPRLLRAGELGPAERRAA